MLRSLDLVAMTRIVPMGFGNARHGCKSTEEHECEDDDSLHLDLTPSISIAYEVSHRLRGRQPLYGRMLRRNLARTHKFGSRGLPSHSHLLNIHGESYRLREKKQAGLFGVGSARSRSTERLKTPLDRTAKGWVNHH
jgi:hypothetical protein